MSLNSNPLLYLNMGGEMLYVLHQRLKAQNVEANKTIQVLNDVTSALLDPRNLSIVFQRGPNLGLPYIRGNLESVALSSIMKLDEDSMNKLFDLMMMMVKYQLFAATGPREILLLTLNHIDALRNMFTQTENSDECITLVHKMVIDMYGELTYDEIWAARNDCLNTLSVINVRVSILLRLGLQNEDTTFNITPQDYNEKFEERQAELGTLKLMENTCRGCNIGSLTLFGDRVTQLGKNIYSPGYEKVPKVKPMLRVRERSFKDRGTKAELGMLAVQLGTEETSAIVRPFSLDLFDDEIGAARIDSNLNDDKSCDENKISMQTENPMKIDADYKAKLDNIRADLFDDDRVDRKMNLLQLLDEAE